LAGATGHRIVTELDVNEDESVYYDGGYWNNFDATLQMFRQRVADGSPGRWFSDYFAHRSKPFERALFLNCGNGWVEREMVGDGVVREGVGIDYSEGLLQEARQEAAALDLPLTYHQMNVNTAEFPPGPFDLVVNYAAAHHISMIDRVFRAICRMLPEDGCFLSWDYVGPHRNQYWSVAWERAWALNDELPPHLRQAMEYPNVSIMLQVDPTEAVHSELIVETLHRYFDVERFVPLGGAIAYPILTHNQRLLACEDKAEQTALVERVLREDDAFLAEYPESTLFAYIVATPDKKVLGRAEDLVEWEKEEAEREDRARANGGVYYSPTALQDAYDRLIGESVVSAQLRAQVADLEGQLAAIRSDPLVSRLTRLRGSRLASGIHSAPVLGPLYDRLRK
jgi:ubiquinone/menaquinone biosynthesis C-methylase UbiE